MLLKRRKIVNRRSRCYNCNEEGHYAFNCKHPKREKGSCFRYGKQGHQVSQCSMSKEEINYVAQQSEDDFHRTLQVQIYSNGTDYIEKLVSLLDIGSLISFIKKMHVPNLDITYKFMSTKEAKFYGINNNIID